MDGTAHLPNEFFIFLTHLDIFSVYPLVCPPGADAVAAVSWRFTSSSIR